MPIKSFRGQIKDEGTDLINLHTKDGSTGYRITKFQNINAQPGSQMIEGVMKIYKVPQTGTPDGLVDFNDQTLLAVCYHEDNDSTAYSTSQVIIFDNEIFNQDIYITFKDVSTGQAMNYYIELEQVKLDLSENTVATLKDIRNIEAQSV